MLSKVNTLYDVFNVSFTKTLPKNNGTNMGTYTITKAGELTVTFTLWYTVGNNYYFNILYNGGTSIASQVRGDYTFTKYFNVWDTIVITWYNNSSVDANFTVYLIGKAPNEDTIPGKPSEIKSIWDLGLINIFWIINNDFFVGTTSNTATTGSITPGNFVGYLQIGNYKIPYYDI